MGEEWPEVLLGDLTDLLTGYPFTSADYCEERDGIRLMRGDNVIQRTVRWEGAKYWPRSLGSSFGSYQLEEGDVVLAMDRPWIEAGLKVAILRQTDIPSLLVQRVARLRAREGLDQGYLGWVLYSPQFTAHVLAVQTGTAVPHISGPQIREYWFRLPSLREQRQIAEVLGALDDLIETNATLAERLLRSVNAEFQCRFGDRPPALTVSSCAFVVDCLHSKKPTRLDCGQLLLQLNNISDSGLLNLADKYLIDSSDYTRWTKNLETRPWDCVITNVGRVGAVARIPDGVPAALGRNMTAIRPMVPARDGAFLLAALISPQVAREIEMKTDTGTILNALNVRSIPQLRLPQAEAWERARFQNELGAMIRTCGWSSAG